MVSCGPRSSSEIPTPSDKWMLPKLANHVFGIKHLEKGRCYKAKFLRKLGIWTLVFWESQLLRRFIFLESVNSIIAPGNSNPRWICSLFIIIIVVLIMYNTFWMIATCKLWAEHLLSIICYPQQPCETDIIISTLPMRKWRLCALNHYFLMPLTERVLPKRGKWLEWTTLPALGRDSPGSLSSSHLLQRCYLQTTWDCVPGPV